MPRTYEVVYRWCDDHQHVEKGRRFPDGRVVITKPEALAEGHKSEDGSK